MTSLIIPFLLLLLSGLVALVLWQQRQLKKALQEIKDHQTQANQQLWNQIEAWHWLRDRLQLQQGFYLDTFWSASPDFLKLIAAHCLEQKPEIIVECSSGASTLVLAAACRINGRGRVLSLEHGAEHAERTRAELERHGLDAYAQVRLAPLESVEISGQHWLWYQQGPIPAPINLLVIDGPPGRLQPLSRYPALPLLRQYLASSASIFLDDAARPDEQEAVRRWQASFPELVHKYLETTRGCSMLKNSKEPS
jgi:predicted O-methyltransferase YrrM